MRWTRDKTLWALLVIGLLMRVLPLAFWPDDGCIRDECTYLKLATRMADGQGMTTSAGWLWAPGYPALLGIHKAITGWASSIKALQIISAMVSGVFVYLLGRRMSGDDPRGGRIAAGLYLLSPHMAFFAMRLWSEVIYGTILLGALLLTAITRTAHDEGGRRPLALAGAVGLLVGICVLFRGVATYMLPIFMLGMIWTRWRSRTAWAQAAMVALVAVLTVAPYSMHATAKFGERVVTDRTMGQMMWLGNNDFDPISFDYGNGKLSRRAFERTRKLGRKPCASRKSGLEREACQTQAGFDWIKANPAEFVRRMPMRVAQLLNPHSLLTRHLRWGRWPGMPQLLDEAIIAWNAVWSLAVLLLGPLAIALRGRGSRGLVYGAILAYHAAAIGALAGLTRYRVPLEPLLMVYIASMLAQGTGHSWREAPAWRRALAVGVMLIITPLVLWYLPAGWLGWRTW